MNSSKETCKNCENQFDESFAFCPYCGQQAKEELTVSVLFYNTISNYFSFDARFFKSFIPLMLKPGVVAKRFVEGKRLKYLHPAQYYLFVTVVFFFIFSFKVREYNENANKALEKGFKMVEGKTVNDIVAMDSLKLQNLNLKDSIMNAKVVKEINAVDKKELDSVMNEPIFSFDYDRQKLDSLIAIGAPEEIQLKLLGLKDDTGFFKRQFLKQLLKFHKNRGGGIVQAFFDSIPIALFFLLPIFAVILKIFYWKRGTFAHHLVFSFYFFSFLFIVLGIVIAVNQWIINLPDVIDWLIMFSTFIYLWIGFKRFYEQGYLMSLLKAGMSTFIYLVLIAPAAFFIILITSFLFY